MRDDGFPEVLLNPVGRHPIVLFQCDDRVPIYVMDDWSEPAPRLALPSIGELVRIWISYMDRGLATIDPDGSWRSDSATYPQNVLDLGVY